MLEDFCDRIENRRPENSKEATPMSIHVGRLATVAAFLCAAPLHGAITVTSDGGINTRGLTGFKTYVLTATSDGAPIQGFDFVGDPTAPIDPATSRGFFGPLNQTMPFLTTVWDDPPPLIPCGPGPQCDPLADSRFKFYSFSLLIIPGSARESATMLQAAFSTSPNFGQSVPFVQLAIPNGGIVHYRGVVGTTDGLEFNIAGTVGVPEPATAALVGLTLISFAVARYAPCRQ
jgi:hypothetical protein